MPASPTLQPPEPRVTDPVPFEAELFERIHWLIRLRWFAVLGTGLALFVAWLWFPDGLPWLPLVSVTGAIMW